MPPSDPSALLRAGLLEGVAMLLVRAGADGAPADAIRAGCGGLGARVFECLALGSGPAAADEEAPAGGSAVAEEEAVARAVERALAESGGLDLAIVDGWDLFCAAQGLGDERPQSAWRALALCMEAAWCVTRTLAASGFIADGRGGRIVFVAPPAGAGEHAAAARAGLENLARTLSIEWARHGITAVAISPSERTAAGELAALVAYLASPAGAYFSGCLLDLGRVG